MKQVSLRVILLVCVLLGFCASGASVANAAIKIANTDTGQVRQVPTNSEGQFVAPGLQIGHYTVRAEAAGFKAAEDHDEDRFHSVGKIDEHTGEPLSASTAETWTDLFSDELVRLGSTDERIVAITAAMLLGGPTAAAWVAVVGVIGRANFRVVSNRYLNCTLSSRPSF